jgi:hypothetical protein
METEADMAMTVTHDPRVTVSARGDPTRPRCHLSVDWPKPPRLRRAPDSRALDCGIGSVRGGRLHRFQFPGQRVRRCPSALPVQLKSTDSHDCRPPSDVSPASSAGAARPQWAGARFQTQQCPDCQQGRLCGAVHAAFTWHREQDAMSRQGRPQPWRCFFS